jgi:hypothetical protein
MHIPTKVSLPRHHVIGKDDKHLWGYKRSNAIILLNYTQIFY